MAIFCHKIKFGVDFSFLILDQGMWMQILEIHVCYDCCYNLVATFLTSIA